MKVRFSITLDKEVVKELDKKREIAPRSTYLNKLIRKKFKMKGGKNEKK